MVFSGLTFLVAIPSGIKVFNWLATLYKGSIVLDTPMLYALAFMFLFTIGGLTGLFLGTLSIDVHLHDTYFVVAHFHYVMMGGTVIGFLGGLHYWWPKMSGRMYTRSWAQVGCVLLFIGFNLTFFPQFIMGSRGMPRRYYDYLDSSSRCTAFDRRELDLGAEPVHDRGYLLASLRKPADAPENPWGGTTLEWQTSSPPIEHNFDDTAGARARAVRLPARRRARWPLSAVGLKIRA